MKNNATVLGKASTKRLATVYHTVKTNTKLTDGEDVSFDIYVRLFVEREDWATQNYNNKQF